MSESFWRRWLAQFWQRWELLVFWSAVSLLMLAILYGWLRGVIEFESAY